MRSETSKTKPFRINAKKFLLTYSHPPGSMPPNTVIHQLQEQIDVENYVIGVKEHEDGSRHFHVIVLSSIRQYFRSTVKFTVHYQGKAYGCNCTGIKNLSGAVRYVCKSGAYVTNIKNFHYGALIPVDQLLRSMVQEEGVPKDLTYYYENY